MARILNWTGKPWPPWGEFPQALSLKSLTFQWSNHTQSIFSNTEVRIPLGFLPEMWIPKAVLPTGLAVDGVFWLSAVWDPLLTAHSFRAPDTGSNDTLVMIPTTLKQASRVILWLQVYKYQQPSWSRATWVIITELLTWRLSVTPLDKGGCSMGQFATAVPLAWAVPCCPPSPELFQPYLGVPAPPAPWEPSESHQNTPRLGIFARVRRNTAPEQTRAQDQNFSFNPGSLLRTH